MAKKRKPELPPELNGIDLSKYQTAAKRKARIVSLISGLVFLFVFQVSEQIHDMLFSFLDTQDIPHYTPINIGNRELLAYIFISVVSYCIILIIFRWIQYDKIKKKLRSASYVLGHIFVCFPFAFLALRGINKAVTLLFLKAPFTVWNIAWLIADLTIYLFIYKPITKAMEGMADSYLKKEKKSHSLKILYKSTGEKEKVIVERDTFSLCYQVMKTNLKDIRPGQEYVITQYAPFKKPMHSWHYNERGELRDTEG